MPQHGFDKNLIRRIFFFNIQRGDPLDFQKRFLQCRGVIFQKKKILRFWKSLKYVQECPVKCLWLKSKIAQLSPMPLKEKRVLKDRFSDQPGLNSIGTFSKGIKWIYVESRYQICYLFKSNYRWPYELKKKQCIEIVVILPCAVTWMAPVLLNT